MDDDLFEIEDLDENAWHEIRSYALVYFKNGDFEGNQMKSSIKAFITYLSKSEKQVIIEHDDYIGASIH